MIPTLTSLICESPDSINFNGEPYTFEDEEALSTFSIIHDLVDKKAVTVAFLHNEGKLISDSITLNEFFKSNYSHWELFAAQFPAYHDDIHTILVRMGRMKGRDRSNAIILGRTWKIDTAPGKMKTITSFWNGHNQVKSNLSNLKKYYNLIGENITDGLFEFLGARGKFMTYREAFLSFIPPEKQKITNQDLEDLKKAHLAKGDDKKRILLKALGNAGPDKVQKVADKLGMSPIELRQKLGMDIAEQSVVKEDPDGITPHGETLEYYDENVLGVFMVWTFFMHRKFTSWVLGDKTDNKLYLGGKFIGDIEYDWDTHSDVWANFFHKIGKHGLKDKLKRVDRICHGRIYKDPMTKEIYVSFWETKEVVAKVRGKIDRILKHFNSDSQDAYYQFRGMEMDQFLSYKEAFDVSTTIKTDKETERKWKEAEQLHLLPPEKKRELLRKLGAADTPNKLQKVADMFDIPVIKLKQLLGRDIAETQDIDQNIKPQRCYQLYNLNLDTKPPYDLRTWANEDET